MTGPDRLYNLAGADGPMSDSLAGVYEADIEPYLELVGETQTIEEWTVHPPSYHLPTVERLREWIIWEAIDELTEEAGEAYERASKEPEVLAALAAALDLIADRVVVRMADKLVATHTLTWTDDGAPLLDGEPLSYPAVVLNGACDFFRWVGQSIAFCDNCQRPAWDHAYGDARPTEPFGTVTRQPWSKVMLASWVRNGWITEERALQLRAVQPDPATQP